VHEWLRVASGCHCALHKIVSCQPRAQVCSHPTRGRQRCVLACFQERKASHLRSRTRRLCSDAVTRELSRLRRCARIAFERALPADCAGQRLVARDSSKARTRASCSVRSASRMVYRRDSCHRLPCWRRAHSRAMARWLRCSSGSSISEHYVFIAHSQLRAPAWWQHGPWRRCRARSAHARGDVERSNWP